MKIRNICCIGPDYVGGLRWQLSLKNDFILTREIGAWNDESIDNIPI